MEEIPSYHHLDTPERGSLLIPYFTGDTLKLVEQIAINHRYLINDKHPCAQPSSPSFLILPDLFDQLLGSLFSESDTSKAVESNTANVASRKTS